MVVTSNHDDTMESTALTTRHWPNPPRKKPYPLPTRLPLPQPTFQTRLPAYHTEYSIENRYIYVKNR